MKIDRNERFLALIAATGHFAYFVRFTLVTQVHFAPDDTNVWTRPELRVSLPRSSIEARRPFLQKGVNRLAMVRRLVADGLERG
jgi:hypothetical protein